MPSVHRGSRGSARRRGASRRSRRRPSLRRTGSSSSTTTRARCSSSRSRSISCRSRPNGDRRSPSSASSGSGSWRVCQQASVADRLGPDGAEAWRIVSGEAGATGRRPQAAGEIAEELEFPEAVGNSLTLERALSALLDRLLARPERGGRAPRRIALSARFVGGGSWRRSLTLREPTVGARAASHRVAAQARRSDRARARAAARAGRAGRLGRNAGGARPPARKSRLSERLRSGLRQARAGVGLDAVCTVVEVAPWSRIPETRAILVPRDD